MSETFDDFLKNLRQFLEKEPGDPEVLDFACKQAVQRIQLGEPERAAMIAETALQFSANSSMTSELIRTRQLSQDWSRARRLAQDRQWGEAGRALAPHLEAEKADRSTAEAMLRDYGSWFRQALAAEDLSALRRLVDQTKSFIPDSQRKNWEAEIDQLRVKVESQRSHHIRMRLAALNDRLEATQSQPDLDQRSAALQELLRDSKLLQIELDSKEPLYEEAMAQQAILQQVLQTLDEQRADRDRRTRDEEQRKSQLERAARLEQQASILAMGTTQEMLQEADSKYAETIQIYQTLNQIEDARLASEKHEQVQKAILSLPDVERRIAWARRYLHILETGLKGTDRWLVTDEVISSRLQQIFSELRPARENHPNSRDVRDLWCQAESLAKQLGWSEDQVVAVAASPVHTPTAAPSPEPEANQPQPVEASAGSTDVLPQPASIPPTLLDELRQIERNHSNLVQVIKKSASLQKTQATMLIGTAMLSFVILGLMVYGFISSNLIPSETRTPSKSPDINPTLATEVPAPAVDYSATISAYSTEMLDLRTQLTALPANFAETLTAIPPQVITITLIHTPEPAVTLSVTATITTSPTITSQATPFDLTTLPVGNVVYDETPVWSQPDTTSTSVRGYSLKKKDTVKIICQVQKSDVLWYKISLSSDPDNVGYIPDNKVTITSADKEKLKHMFCPEWPAPLTNSETTTATPTIGAITGTATPTQPDSMNTIHVKTVGDGNNTMVRIEPNKDSTSIDYISSGTDVNVICKIPGQTVTPFWFQIVWKKNNSQEVAYVASIRIDVDDTKVPDCQEANAALNPAATLTPTPTP